MLAVLLVREGLLKSPKPWWGINLIPAKPVGVALKGGEVT